MSRSPQEDQPTPHAPRVRAPADWAQAIQAANATHVLQHQADAKLQSAKALLASRTDELTTLIAVLRATLDADPDGIVAFDRKQQIVKLNERFSSMWSLTPDKLRDDSYVSRLPRMALHVNDAEQAHHRSAEQLRESQELESLGALAGGIAHDFNNVLSTILGDADLARVTASAENRDALESLQAVRQAGERASALVQQILTFRRQQTHELGPVHLGAVVQDTVMLLKTTAPAGIELTTGIDHTAPVIVADRGLVQQAILNLCANAFQALHDRPESTGRIEIVVTHGVDAAESDALTVGTLPQGAFVAVQITDNGIGMAPETGASILDPSFPMRTMSDGVGIGLSVVQGIMDVHHGAIRVQSVLNKGTTFTLFFPCATRDPSFGGHAEVNGAGSTDTPPDVDGPPSADEPPERIGAGCNPHVLYVDDDPMLVSLVTRLLRQADFRVTGLRSAVEAMDSLVNHHVTYDIIVTDFNMPELTGLDLARISMDLHPTTPVVITSGFVTQELQIEAEQLGVREVLHKPELTKRLVPVVRQLLHHVTV